MKAFSARLFSIIFPILDQIYLLQMDEYKIGDYIKKIPENFFKRNLQQDGKLETTPYVKKFLVALTIFNGAMFIPFAGNIPMIIFLSILPIILPQVLIIGAYSFLSLYLSTVSFFSNLTK